MHSCSDTNVRNYFETEKMLKQGVRSQMKGSIVRAPSGDKDQVIEVGGLGKTIRRLAMRISPMQHLP